MSLLHWSLLIHTGHFLGNEVPTEEATELVHKSNKDVRKGRIQIIQMLAILFLFTNAGNMQAIRSMKKPKDLLINTSVVERKDRTNPSHGLSCPSPDLQ